MEHVNELDLRSVRCPNEKERLSVAELLYGAETPARIADETERHDDAEDKVSRPFVLALRY
jgi:hypothetical protein